MVPTFTWGLVLTYFFLAISSSTELLLSPWSQLHACFGDELFGEARWKLLIMMEFHAVVGSALSHAAQVGRIAEHRRKRNFGVHDVRCRATLHAEDLSTTPREITHDVAHELLGHEDVDTHDRLQQHGFRLANAVLESHRPGDGECLLGRVDVVVRTVDEAHL